MKTGFVTNLPHAPGLYKIIFPSGRFYIGMTTKSIKRRIWRHFAHTNAGAQTPVARAIRKYGQANICVEPLVICEDIAALRIMEERAIQVFKPGYNIRTAWHDTPDTTGYHHTQEARQRIAAAQKGRTRSLETRRRMALSQNCTSVRIGGKVFYSLAEAGRFFGLNTASVLYRVNSSRYEEWQYG